MSASRRIAAIMTDVGESSVCENQMKVSSLPTRSLGTTPSLSRVNHLNA